MQNPPVVDTSAADITGADYEASFAGTSCTYTYEAVAGKTLIYDTSDGSLVINN